MQQSTINNSNEFIIETVTSQTKDFIYFADTGDTINISIEDSGREEANGVIYKNNAVELLKWLMKHLEVPKVSP